MTRSQEFKIQEQNTNPTENDSWQITMITFDRRIIKKEEFGLG